MIRSIYLQFSTDKDIKKGRGCCSTSFTSGALLSASDAKRFSRLAEPGVKFLIEIFGLVT